MMYDERCLERNSNASEEAYLSQSFTAEDHQCADCGDYETELIDGEWLCKECEEERFWARVLPQALKTTVGCPNG